MALVSVVMRAAGGDFFVRKLTMFREFLAVCCIRRAKCFISIYRQLIDAANRLSGMLKEQADNLEAALRNVMLLGEA